MTSSIETTNEATTTLFAGSPDLPSEVRTGLDLLRFKQVSAATLKNMKCSYCLHILNTIGPMTFRALPPATDAYRVLMTPYLEETAREIVASALQMACDTLRSNASRLDLCGHGPRVPQAPSTHNRREVLDHRASLAMI